MNRSQADIGITSFGGRLSLSTAVLFPGRDLLGPFKDSGVNSSLTLFVGSRQIRQDLL